ncbi:MAG: DinB family protein [Fimbriimonadaceae bacterium]
MNNRYLIKSLELSPLAFARLVDAIPPSEWDRCTDEERFSLRESIAHLADWEPIMRARLSTALESPGTEITSFDEGQRAIDLNYQETDPLEQVQLFAKERAETVRLVESIQDWSGHFIHPEIGVVTTEDMVNTLVGHDVYHLEHLSQYLVD